MKFSLRCDFFINNLGIPSIQFMIKTKKNQYSGLSFVITFMLYLIWLDCQKDFITLQLSLNYLLNMFFTMFERVCTWRISNIYRKRIPGVDDSLRK